MTSFIIYTILKKYTILLSLGGNIVIIIIISIGIGIQYCLSRFDWSKYI